MTMKKTKPYVHPQLNRMREIVKQPALQIVKQAREKSEGNIQEPSQNISKDGDSKILLKRGYLT